MRSNYGPGKSLLVQGTDGPLPRLQPYQRCNCGVCAECQSNAHWDRVFAKFEIKEREDRRIRFRSPIADL